MFNSSFPYSLLTIKHEDDASFHIKTSVYRTQNKEHRYILHVEEYIDNMYVIKFYPLRYKRHDKRYQLLSGDDVMQPLIGTALQIIPDMFSLQFVEV
jgi:hypothetical protein